MSSRRPSRLPNVTSRSHESDGPVIAVELRSQTAGLALVDALARLRLLARRHGGELRVRVACPDLRKVITLAGLNEVLSDVGCPAMPDVPVLDGKIVRLRPRGAGDLTELVRIRATAEIFDRWRGGDDLTATVEEEIADPDALGFVIEVDGRVAGWIQWHASEEPDYRHAGMDIYLDPAVHGRGVGTDAVRTLARHLIHDHGHHRFTIDPAADNAAAIRTYAKVGFKPVGVMRQYERGNDGTWHDGLLMDLLADEFVDDD